ncbi:hypothetical protein [Actinophytocola sediminis]
MERELGSRLFTRTARGVELTLNGRRFCHTRWASSRGSSVRSRGPAGVAGRSGRCARSAGRSDCCAA